MSGETSGRLIVIVPPELENGFRLAGVEVHAAGDVAAATELIDRFVGERRAGVVSVYEPLLAALSEDRRRHLELSMRPVVIPIPSGLAGDGGDSRRSDLLARLQRAVGFQVTFGEDAE